MGEIADEDLHEIVLADKDGLVDPWEIVDRHARACCCWVPEDMNIMRGTTGAISFEGGKQKYGADSNKECAHTFECQGSLHSSYQKGWSQSPRSPHMSAHISPCMWPDERTYLGKRLKEQCREWSQLT